MSDEMDSSGPGYDIVVPCSGVSSSPALASEKESVMQIATVGVDLAKNCFQVAEADSQYRVISRKRLTRTKFSRHMATCPLCQVVMEACGTAHYWARVLKGYGHQVKLLPAQHVRAYVRRNKTDAADAAALIEASRSDEIRSVEVKSVEQQVLQQLHRVRTQWQAARVARINGLRGMLREFGIDVPLGAVRGIASIREALEAGDNGLPDAMRPVIAQLLKEIDDFSERMKEVERLLESLSAEDATVQRLQTIPGVGLIVSTALRAAVSDIHRFPSGRHLSCWLGLTAREHSSAYSGQSDH